MSSLMVIALCIYISLADIANHRISNLSNLLLFAVLSLDVNPSSVRMTLLALAVTIALSLVSRLGGGDFKLISVLILTQGDVLVSRQYLQHFLVFATISFLISSSSRRSFSGSIPMAPAILAPFLIGYLAI